MVTRTVTDESVRVADELAAACRCAIAALGYGADHALVVNRLEAALSAYEIHIAHDAGEDCGQEKCQQCCAHDERDHGICLDCEHEEDPGEAIDRAMDALGDR